MNFRSITELEMRMKMIYRVILPTQTGHNSMACEDIIKRNRGERMLYSLTSFIILWPNMFSNEKGSSK